jgi:hypothetical protein
MSRLLRFSLWGLGLFILVVGASLFWVESQLQPEPLGRRVKDLLAEAGIKGGITRVEASLDGRFSAEGVDLILADGTKVAAAAIKGEARLFAIIRGTYALSSLEIKSLEVDLSSRKPTTKPTEGAAAASSPQSKPTLPPIVLGPYAVSGRVKIADGNVVRFSVRGDGFDTGGKADFRAGLAWPGWAVGKQITDPRGEVILKGEFRRPLGAHGLGVDELLADISDLRLELAAKDASPQAAGSVGFILEAAGAARTQGLDFKGALNDSTGVPALKLAGTHLAGRTTVEAQLDVDPTRFGILSRQLPDIRLTGVAKGALEGAGWQLSTDLKALWPDLSRFSKALAKDRRSEWELRADAHGADGAFAVNNLAITGHGVRIAIPQPLSWKGGLLPENADTATVTIAADDADLIALNPFLAAADVVATAGRWTGEASVSFKDGKPAVTSIRTHSLRGVTLERGGQPLMREVDAELPIRSGDGVISLSPFSVSCAAGKIAAGALTLRPGADGAWSAVADIDVGIVELASQPNWQDLPVDKLKGVRVSARTTVERAAGKPPVIATADARIFRQELNLLSLKLRQPLPLDGSKPAGVLVEAAARDLPLESLAAVIPGLKLTGDLRRADLVAGFNRDGLFVRTEGAPVAFVGTSVSWAGKPYVRDCDLTTGIDLLFGETATTLGFDKAELKNRQRVIAGGDIRVGLGKAATTLKLTGDLGALAEQPFAAPLAALTNGQYRADIQRGDDGEIRFALDIRDVGIRRSEGRISLASAAGRYAPQADGLTAEGTLRVQASQVSSGKFSVSQRTDGARTDWQATATIDHVDIDDLLGLLPKADPTEATEAAPSPPPHRVAFWAGHAGNARLTVGTAKAYGIKVEQLDVRIEAKDDALRLTKLDGRLAEGALSGRGQLTFQPTLNQGPYSLAATVSLKQFDFSAVAAAIPALKDFLEGKADASAELTSISGTPAELGGRLQVTTTLESQGGRIRAFGGKDSKTAALAGKAGDTGELIGGLAMIAGAFTKNQKQGQDIARVGAAMTAAGKLQKAVADFPYASARIKASRLASGTIKLETADIRGETLQLSAQGGISVDPRAPFADWPMSFTTQLRGAGEIGQYFQALGFGVAPSPADGFTEGPGVAITGSLNDIRTDLAEKLRAAVDRVRSSPGAGGTSQPETTPAGQAAPASSPATAPRRRNPLDDLLKELGR